MALETDLELGEVVLILGGVIVIGYGLFKGFSALGDEIKKIWSDIESAFHFGSGVTCQDQATYDANGNPVTKKGPQGTPGTSGGGMGGGGGDACVAMNSCPWGSVNA